MHQINFSVSKETKEKLLALSEKRNQSLYKTVQDIIEKSMSEKNKTQKKMKTINQLDKKLDRKIKNLEFSMDELKAELLQVKKINSEINSKAERSNRQEYFIQAMLNEYVQKFLPSEKDYDTYLENVGNTFDSLIKNLK